MKAIETVYNGYNFRSRLEARWALFLDMLEIPYQYEKEGYDLDHHWYLPDFWLPEHNFWIEIKGEMPNPVYTHSEELQKAILLCEHTNKSVKIFIGDIWYTNGAFSVHPAYDSDMKKRIVCSTINFNYWFECPHCNKLDIISLVNNGDYVRCRFCTGHFAGYLNAKSPNLLQYAYSSSFCLSCIGSAKAQSLYPLLFKGVENLLEPILTTRVLNAYTAARQARFDTKQN